MIWIHREAAPSPSFPVLIFAPGFAPRRAVIRPRDAAKVSLPYTPGVAGFRPQLRRRQARVYGPHR
jgi:hypothetical protein